MGQVARQRVWPVFGVALLSMLTADGFVQMPGLAPKLQNRSPAEISASTVPYRQGGVGACRKSASVTVGTRVEMSGAVVKGGGDVRGRLKQFVDPIAVLQCEHAGQRPKETKEDRDRREFELNRGKAVDTLLLDYDRMFQHKHEMDYSIFSPEVRLEDSVGFSLEGIGAYTGFFSVVARAFPILFNSCKTTVQVMDPYAADKSKIKLRWKLDLESRLHIPEAPHMSSLQWEDVLRAVGLKHPDSLFTDDKLNKIQGSWRRDHPAPHRNDLVLEGVSEYKLNAKGVITQHKITITYPAKPFSLAPLRNLLPVREAHQGLIGAAHGNLFSFSFLHNVLARVVEAFSFQRLLVVVGGAASVPASDLIMMMRDDVGTTRAKATGEKPWGKVKGIDLISGRLPKKCNNDYDCNPGGYNYPLICADFVIAKFCVDPDDWTGGGRRAEEWSEDDLIHEPIPVKVTDGYTRNW